MALNRRFMTFHLKKRPYIVLKWAQTSDGMIGIHNNLAADRLRITNEYSNRLVHKWRTEESSILVGTQTALADDPELTSRLWPGKSPIRLVIDLQLRLPNSLKLFNRQVKTIVFNTLKNEENDNLIFYRISPDQDTVKQVMEALYLMKIQSVIVEGGARVIQSFIDERTWDEARIFTNTTLVAGEGIPSPVLKNYLKDSELEIGSDNLQFYFQDNL
jgi:diaminohydroxyphosphoribosylaminopyrimidine deaminase/5-amino-6-(5-phosphoribosylamino)uracil reductase